MRRSAHELVKDLFVCDERFSHVNSRCMTEFSSECDHITPPSMVWPTRICLKLICNGFQFIWAQVTNCKEVVSLYTGYIPNKDSFWWLFLNWRPWLTKLVRSYWLDDHLKARTSCELVEVRLELTYKKHSIINQIK